MNRSRSKSWCARSSCAPKRPRAGRSARRARRMIRSPGVMRKSRSLPSECPTVMGSIYSFLKTRKLGHLLSSGAPSSGRPAAPDGTDTRFRRTSTRELLRFPVSSGLSKCKSPVVRAARPALPCGRRLDVECAVPRGGSRMPSVAQKVRCPYCRSDRLRAEAPSKSGFSWHTCVACGERFSARVVDSPRRPMKAGLKPPPAKRKRS